MIPRMIDESTWPIEADGANRRKAKRGFVMSRYMSTREAAEYLRISTRTLQRYAREGRLSRIRLSKQKILYIRAEVEELVERNTYRV